MPTTQTKGKVISGFAFHCHHNILVEFVTDYRGRVDYIKEGKPPEEIELRLRLFKMIPVDRLPYELAEARAARDKALAAYDKAKAACDKAWSAYDKTWAAYDETWSARDKVRAAYDKTWSAYDEALAACDETWSACDSYFTQLHKELCPNCPWDGKTILAKEVK